MQSCTNREKWIGVEMRGVQQRRSKSCLQSLLCGEQTPAKQKNTSVKIVADLFLSESICGLKLLWTCFEQNFFGKFFSLVTNRKKGKNWRKGWSDSKVSFVLTRTRSFFLKCAINRSFKRRGKAVGKTSAAQRAYDNEQDTIDRTRESSCSEKKAK